MYPEKLLSAAPGEQMCCQGQNAELMGNIDDRLATAWMVMRRFCLFANLGAQTRRLMQPAIIHQTMTAVMYRLLHMGFAAGSTDEAIRLGLLTFSHHLFLQWQDIKLPYNHFRTLCRDCILRLERVDGVSNQLMFWLLMTGAVSVFDISAEPWLREYLRDCADLCHVSTWKGAQSILKSFMWIELLDEQPGKHIFDLLHLN